MSSEFSSKASISDGIGVHKCIRYGQLACFGRYQNIGMKTCFPFFGEKIEQNCNYVKRLQL